MTGARNDGGDARYGSIPGQSCGNVAMYISTSSVPDCPQLLVNSSRVIVRFVLPCGSAQ